MRVLHLAISTPNLASQICFLLLEAHGPTPISRSSSSSDSLPVWVPELSLELFSHAPTGGEDKLHKCQSEC